eukprot:1185831-Rhodomonas_salina.2
MEHGTPRDNAHVAAILFAGISNAVGKGVRSIAVGWQIRRLELKELNVDSDMREKLGEMLADAVEVCRGLVRLDVSMNKLGAKSAEVLARALRDKRALRELDMHKNE